MFLKIIFCCLIQRIISEQILSSNNPTHADFVKDSNQGLLSYYKGKTNKPRKQAAMYLLEMN